MANIFYSIDAVFISRFGFCIDGEFVLSYPGRYCLIKKNGNRYNSIGVYEEDSMPYPRYETATEEEKENCCLWGKLASIYSYLTDKEVKTKKIHIDRLYEIYDIVNGIITDNREKPLKNGNILSFRPRL